jgi:farnesyl diphosphate synthase
VSAAAVPFDIQSWQQARADEVELALLQHLPTDAPQPLLAAMQYALTGGGKRMRPMLAFAACEAVAKQSSTALPPGMREAVMRAACAVEMIHAYSLVHDDMPCMDDDVLRRGKPTVHVQYGQAQALLAGDALQAQAFVVLTHDTDNDDALPAAAQLRCCQLLSVAAGAQGMAGGQAIDLASVGTALNQSELERMHALKTGALIRAAVAMGGVCAHANAQERAALDVYGQRVGLAFQVVDDVLDVSADTATLGKTAGKDALADKPTFVSLMGLSGAQAYAADLVHSAKAALQDAGMSQSAALHALADKIVARRH